MREQVLNDQKRLHGKLFGNNGDMNKERKRNLENSDIRDNEDLPVIDYIDRINKGQRITMLEVGSGECRFVKKIQKLYPNIVITCIEINIKLASIANSLGCAVINDSILNLSPKDKYDIVHCSHVIEHFGYPEVTKVLDFLVDSVKQEGRLIVRSPLMWKDFYLDIDHVRPYSPRTIALFYILIVDSSKNKGLVTLNLIVFGIEPCLVS